MPTQLQPDPPTRGVTSDSPQRLRVAVIDEELPYPANSGKRIRTLNLMSRLAKWHEITYVAHQNADAGELEQAKSHFAELGIRAIEVPRRIAPKKELVSAASRTIVPYELRMGTLCGNPLRPQHQTVGNQLRHRRGSTRSCVGSHREGKRGQEVGPEKKPRNNV